MTPIAPDLREAVADPWPSRRPQRPRMSLISTAGTREVVMSPPIIVGIDPLRHDPEAPVLAALLARATGAPVLAVAAYETLHRLGSADEYEPRGAALARLSAIEAAFHGLALETAAISGSSAARVLHDCAADRGAGLLVVGATHHGVMGMLALGSTADRLLHGTTCPVAVAPLGFAERMRGIDRVGVAFIESEEGHEALRAAAALASACGAELYAATAVEPLPWSATRLAPPYDVEAHLKHQRGRRRRRCDAPWMTFGHEWSRTSRCS